MGGGTPSLTLRKGRSAERLSERLGHHGQFSYTAWDRIVLNGSLDRRQRPENISSVFRAVVGVATTADRARGQKLEEQETGHTAAEHAGTRGRMEAELDAHRARRQQPPKA